jgi:hypothetical protein
MSKSDVKVRRQALIHLPTRGANSSYHVQPLQGRLSPVVLRIPVARLVALFHSPTLSAVAVRRALATLISSNPEICCALYCFDYV